MDQDNLAETGGDIRRAVFFDRDGTLNEMIYDATHGTMDSPQKADQVRLILGAAEALQQLHAMGYLIIVVTNQPGLAKGTLDAPELEAIQQRLSDQLQERGAQWDALYYCPHHPTLGIRAEWVRDCLCRKPKPGMLLSAARDYRIDLRHSWMIGDGIVDIEAGQAAGCRTILFTQLKLEQIEKYTQLKAVPDYSVPRLADVPVLIRNVIFEKRKPLGNGD